MDTVNSPESSATHFYEELAMQKKNRKAHHQAGVRTGNLFLTRRRINHSAKAKSSDLKDECETNVPSEDHGDEHHLLVAAFVPSLQAPRWVENESNLVEPAPLKQ